MNKKLILDTIINSPVYIQQRVINKLVENGVGTYKKKSEPNLLQFTKKSNVEKIKESLENNNITLKVFDLTEISKGYKNSIFYRYSNMDMNRIYQKYTDINSSYYNECNCLDTLYLEDENHIYIKFHRNIICPEKGDTHRWVDIRYPTLFVIHKDIHILEVRFDRTNLETEKSKMPFKEILDDYKKKIEEDLQISICNINLDKIIRKAVDLYNGDVINELIWSGELTKSKGITLKAGQDMVLPFWGELNIEIENLRNKYKANDIAIRCLCELQDYIDSEKKYANERFRCIRCLKKLENGKYIKMKEYIDIKIIFNYYETITDLITMYDIEKNDMERMDYVIRFIDEVDKHSV